ncbi:hypothetical protein B7W85_04585 [Allorhizobium ampelinum]|uniref:hypothetical protein n=1 Tax=Rhizobium/Agrobacterium group TaxID=227290 RepID=UPI000B402642|nr:MULTISPECIES: hypothetical protein [Rhizobium/Agrobacterium group]MCF1472909.1 hypothetical protein [Allorhizobium ampelinum]MCF1482159.1 hypothetical protein [Allorhizobium ampelinum]OVE96454.1 hypothetical protein B7W85_04585 [Allorhizobium ampelinum]BCH65359.1 hypothetical protein RvVAT039_25750 [Agrobacterium vitis]
MAGYATTENATASLWPEIIAGAGRMIGEDMISQDWERLLQKAVFWTGGIPKCSAAGVSPVAFMTASCRASE